MELTEIYRGTHQKSKTFLYPMLLIKRTANIQPLNTYISWEDMYEPKDMKLVVVYENDESQGFKTFEEEVLRKNYLYHKHWEIPSKVVYAFDFERFKVDWFNFIWSKYSQLSSAFSSAIKAYYGPFSTEWKHIDSYLHPGKYYEQYAKILNISAKLLREGVELCSRLNLEAETLRAQKHEQKLLVNS